MEHNLRAYLAEIGRKGGQVKSEAKSKAARANIRARWAKVKEQNKAQERRNGVLMVKPPGGRNALCLCQSGKKWKRCHGMKERSYSQSGAKGH